VLLTCSAATAVIAVTAVTAVTALTALTAVVGQTPSWSAPSKDIEEQAGFIKATELLYKNGVKW